MGEVIQDRFPPRKLRASPLSVTLDRACGKLGTQEANEAARQAHLEQDAEQVANRCSVPTEFPVGD
jgi:hypothetical protein